MPETEVVFYREDDGTAPVLDWLDGLPLRARLKCLEKVERLRQLGHELRRPEGDLLRNGIYELRISLNHVQYRILYAFHTEAETAPKQGVAIAGRGAGARSTARRTIAVLAHGIMKERRVPGTDIDRAIGRMDRFRADPRRHTYIEGG